MIIDVHTHIFPPEIVSSREDFFKDEPAFRLLYGSPKSRMVTANSLIEMMDEEGIDISVIFGFPWMNYDLMQKHNDYILESAERYKGRLIPLACVYPLHDRASFEIARCMDNGAYGAGELAVYGQCEVDRAVDCYKSIISVVRERKGLVLIHANEPVGHAYPGKAPQGLEFYYNIARISKGVPLIFAHWGGGLFFYFLLKKEAKDVLENVYFDTAASPFLYDLQIYSIASQVVGAERILFGSDYPLIKPSRYFKELNEAELEEKEIELISGLNAARLFGLSEGV